MKKILSPKDLLSIRLNNIEGILIDIDDTLYSYKSSHRKSIKSCFKKFDILYPNKYNFKQFNSLYRSARTEVTNQLKMNGSCRSRLLAFKMMFESLENSNKIDAYKNAMDFEDFYWKVLIDNIKKDNDVFEFISICHSKSIKICAVSDMQTMYQIRKLDRMGYRNMTLVTSEEVGVEKPHPDIFSKALTKINCLARHTIMIGDNYEKDIIGAQKMGMQAFHITLDD